jgi:hypothetical protein
VRNQRVEEWLTPEREERINHLRERAGRPKLERLDMLDMLSRLTEAELVVLDRRV